MSYYERGATHTCHTHATAHTQRTLSTHSAHAQRTLSTRSAHTQRTLTALRGVEGDHPLARQQLRQAHPDEMFDAVLLAARLVTSCDA